MLPLLLLVLLKLGRPDHNCGLRGLLVNVERISWTSDREGPSRRPYLYYVLGPLPLRATRQGRRMTRG
jgi:hypothetical protein